MGRVLQLKISGQVFTVANLQKCRTSGINHTRKIGRSLRAADADVVVAGAEPVQSILPAIARLSRFGGKENLLAILIGHSKRSDFNIGGVVSRTISHESRNNTPRNHA